MTGLPEPLTPPDCDLRDFPRMMVDIGRLRQSTFDAMLDDRAWRAGLNLWFSAWHSVPAGSLDAEPAALVKAAGLGRDLKTFREIETEALRGFVRCSDGRLYHAVVAETALEAWIEKLLQRLVSGAGNAKRWGAEFDPRPIEQALGDAASRLSKIAPTSKSVAKAMRKASRGDRLAIPQGSGGDPDGMDDASRWDHEPSRRDSRQDGKSVPSRSQGKGRERVVELIPHTSPDTPRVRAPGPASLDAACQRIFEAAGMRTMPADKAIVRGWLTLPDMQLERDIVPIVERVAGQVRNGGGKAPFAFKYFDAAVREQHAADVDAIERLERIHRRNSGATQ